MAAKKTPGKVTASTRSSAKKVGTKVGKQSAAGAAAPPETPLAAGGGQMAASALITARIRAVGGWRGEKLAHVRRLIHEADPAIVEEWKWETPVWSHDGIVCTGETYKEVVKLTFAKGASLADPHRLFNSSMTGNVRRAIDVRAEDEIDPAAFQALIQEAVAYNRAHAPRQRVRP